MIVVFLAIALVMAIAAVIFALLNTDPITVSYLFGEITGSETVVLLVAYGAGALTMLIMLLPGIIKVRFRLRKQGKQIKDLAKPFIEEEKKIQEKKQKPEKAPEIPEPVVEEE